MLRLGPGIELATEVQALDWESNTYLFSFGADGLTIEQKTAGLIDFLKFAFN